MVSSNWTVAGVYCFRPKCSTQHALELTKEAKKRQTSKSHAPRSCAVFMNLSKRFAKWDCLSICTSSLSFSQIQTRTQTNPRSSKEFQIVPEKRQWSKSHSCIYAMNFTDQTKTPATLWSVRWNISKCNNKPLKTERFIISRLFPCSPTWPHRRHTFHFHTICVILRCDLLNVQHTTRIESQSKANETQDNDWLWRKKQSLWDNFILDERRFISVVMLSIHTLFIVFVSLGSLDRQKDSLKHESSTASKKYFDSYHQKLLDRLMLTTV